MINNDIVIGLQYGDEGKGKIVNHLINNKSYNLCVKTNGGPNAGHTIYINENKLVLHQLPVGIVNKDIKCLIGPNCVVDMNKLEEEIKMVEEVIDFDIESKIKKRLFIAYNAHVIKIEHIEEDCRTDKIGSTKCGIRPAYRDKYNRCGTRIIDLKLGSEWNIVDSYTLFNNSVNNSVLFEISQGFNLDIDFGKYPFVTSSQCHIGNIVSCGFPIKKINKIYGIAKIYSTYVGNMGFQSDDPKLVELQILGNEFGSTTGRKRQCNWLDLDELKKAININGVTELIINKCDIIEKLNYFKLYHNNEYSSNLNEHIFESWDKMKEYIINNLPNINIIFSYNKDSI